VELIPNHSRGIHSLEIKKYFLKKIKKYLLVEKKICNFAPPKRRRKEKEVERKSGTRSQFDILRLRRRV
jgi:hypothetical protein